MLVPCSLRRRVCAGSGRRATWHTPRCVLKRSGKLGGVNRAPGSQDFTNKLPSVVVAGAGQTAAEDLRGSVTRSAFVVGGKETSYFVELQQQRERLMSG